MACRPLFKVGDNYYWIQEETEHTSEGDYVDAFVKIFELRAPSTTAIFNRNRDVHPDRGCGCCWWSAHPRRDRSVQSFSVYTN